MYIKIFLARNSYKQLAHLFLGMHFYKNQLFSAEAQLLLFQKHLIIIETQFVLIVFSFYYTEVWYKLNFYILLSYVILKK